MDKNIKSGFVGELALFDAKEIMRPDANIAKWSGLIFSSPWAKDLYEEKIIKIPSGEASISIIPALNRKRPTTTTQKVLYALIQIWEESGKLSDGRVSFSARQLAHILCWRWAGKDTAERIQEQLFILNSTTIDWERSFHRGDYLETQKEEMNLIDAKSYLKREKMRDREFFSAQHNVRLNQDLVYNMIEGKTKPINYFAYISIKNDGAIKLYNFLDNFLYSKVKWERRSYELITVDLEYSGKRYEERRIRLAKLKDLVKCLDGKEISSGILSLSIAKTVDGLDYKLVVRKSPLIRANKKRTPPKLANNNDDIPFIVDEIIDGLGRLGNIDGDKAKNILGILARWYKRDLLLHALSAVKADFRGNIKTTPIKTYMYQVHVMAHEQGLEWIKDCGKSCKHRPEKREQFTLDFQHTKSNESQKITKNKTCTLSEDRRKREAEEKVRLAKKRKEKEDLYKAYEEEKNKISREFKTSLSESQLEDLRKEFEKTDKYLSANKATLKLYQMSGINGMWGLNSVLMLIQEKYLPDEYREFDNWLEFKKR